MNRLRSKLVVVFLAATLVPLAAIFWVSSALMKRSLALVESDDVATVSQSLEQVAREYYRQSRDQLARDAASGLIEPRRYGGGPDARWPAEVREFWDSGEAERFVLSVPDGSRLHYLVRRDGGIVQYSRDLPIRLGEVTRQLRRARAYAGDLAGRDLARGFTLALAVTSAVVWLFALAIVIYLSSRISTPVEQLTAGLADLARGKFETRIGTDGRRAPAAEPGEGPGAPCARADAADRANAPTTRAGDEIRRAIEAFNRTAGELQQSRNRLVYLTQVASWQTLARKMAHELKNSLTPIRLTVEEIAARRPDGDDAFLDRAARIVVDEVDSLERRVRAFSEFAAEPPSSPSALDLAVMLEERVGLLRAAHPDVVYRLALDHPLPRAWADADQVKGILTNLLENAAEAAGPGGTVLAAAAARDANVIIDVHDSGPGLTPEARRMLFEPTISFKARGMGLGLAISRKNALLAGGDLAEIEGRLGGAAFRLAVPAVQACDSESSSVSTPNGE